MTVPAPLRRRTLFIVSALTVGAVFAGALRAQAPPPPSGASAAAAGNAAANQPPAGGAKAPAGAAAAKAPASEKSTVSYSLGLSMGEQLRAGYVKPEQVSPERLAQGIRDGLSGKAKLSDADREQIRKLLSSAHEAAGDINHRAAAKFLAENAKKPGVVTTASGLQYKVLEPGNGDSPKSTDEVTVNYRGTLLDGTEFDSSYKRSQPANFQLNRVIPGWSEGLLLMKPGAKYQLWIPPQLGYDLHSPGPIPPGAMLIFEVELLGVKAPSPPAATAQPGGAQPGGAQPPAPASQPSK
jgi:FKBP-type peptidyl-prolyl cis-trans isomerase FkpA